MNSQPHHSPRNIIVCTFSRDRIQNQDLTSFLDRWGPDKLPAGPELRPLMNSMVFDFQGYGDDPRRICTNPEVRAFLQHFFKVWPFWFLTADLANPSLLYMSLACLSDVRVVRDTAGAVCDVQFNPGELHRFIQRGLANLACVCWRAGVTNDEVCDRALQIYDYFDLECANVGGGGLADSDDEAGKGEWRI